MSNIDNTALLMNDSLDISCADSGGDPEKIRQLQEEIDHMKADHQRKNDWMKCKLRENTELKNTVSTLQTERDGIRGQLSDRELQVAGMSGHIKELEERLESDPRRGSCEEMDVTAGQVQLPDVTEALEKDTLILELQAELRETRETQARQKADTEKLREAHKLLSQNHLALENDQKTAISESALRIKAAVEENEQLRQKMNAMEAAIQQQANMSIMDHSASQVPLPDATETFETQNIINDLEDMLEERNQNLHAANAEKEQFCKKIEALEAALQASQNLMDQSASHVPLPDVTEAFEAQNAIMRLEEALKKSEEHRQRDIDTVSALTAQKSELEESLASLQAEKMEMSEQSSARMSEIDARLQEQLKLAEEGVQLRQYIAKMSNLPDADKITLNTVMDLEDRFINQNSQISTLQEQLHLTKERLDEVNNMSIFNDELAEKAQTISHLSDQKSALEQQRDVMTNELEKHHRENIARTQEIHRLNDLAGTFQDENMKLNRQINDLKDQVALNEDSAQLEAQLAVACQQKADLANRLHQCEEVLVERTNVVEELQKQLGEAKGAGENTENQLNEMIQLTESRVGQLEGKLNEQRTRAESLEATRTHTLQQLENIDSVFKEQSDELATVKQNLETAMIEISMRTEQTAELENKLAGIREEKNESDGMYREAESQLEKMVEGNENLSSALEELRLRNDELVAQLAPMVDLQCERDNLEGQLIKITEKVATLENSLATTHEEAALSQGEATAAVDSLKAQIAELSAQVEQTQQDLATATTRAEEFEAKVGLAVQDKEYALNQLEQMTSQNENLNAEASVHAEDLKSLETRFETEKSALIQEKDALEARLSEATATNQAVEISRQGLADEITEKVGEIQALDSKVEEQNSKISDFQAKIGDLEGQISEKETYCSAAAGEICQLKEQIEALGGELDRRGSEISHSQEVAKGTAEKMGELAESLRKTEETCLSQADQLAAVGEVCGKQESEIEILKENVEAQTAISLEQRNEIVRLSEELVKANDICDSEKQEASKLLQDMETLRNSNETLAKQVESMTIIENENKSYLGTIEELRADVAKHVISITDLQKHVDDTEAVNLETKTSLESAMDNLAKLEADRSNAEKRLEETDGGLQEMSQSNAKLEEQVTVLTEKCDGLEVRLEELLREKVQLEKHHSDLQQTNSDFAKKHAAKANQTSKLEREVQSLGSTVAEKQEMLSELRANMHDMKADLEIRESTISELETTVCDLRERVECAETSKAEIETLMVSFQTAKDTLTETNANLQNMLDEKSQELDGFTEQLDTTVKLNEDLTATLGQTKEQLDGAEKKAALVDTLQETSASTVKERDELRQKLADTLTRVTELEVHEREFEEQSTVDSNAQQAKIADLEAKLADSQLTVANLRNEVQAHSSLDDIKMGLEIAEREKSTLSKEVVAARNERDEELQAKTNAENEMRRLKDRNSVLQDEKADLQKTKESLLKRVQEYEVQQSKDLAKDMKRLESPSQGERLKAPMADATNKSSTPTEGKPTYEQIAKECKRLKNRNERMLKSLHDTNDKNKAYQLKLKKYYNLCKENDLLEAAKPVATAPEPSSRTTRSTRGKEN